MNILKYLFGATLAVGTAAQAHATPITGESVQLNSYILLDRTGSMNSIWDEALGSVNAYVESVITPDDGPNVANDITFSVFAASSSIRYGVMCPVKTGG